MGTRHDFDFLPGSWRVRHRRRTNALEEGATPIWTEFDTTTTATLILDGLGNTDDTSGELPDGSPFSGHTLRLYDPDHDLWRIWWASTNRPGVLDPPVEGRFEAGVGTFVGPFEHQGRTLVARFRWLETQTACPRWEQDFSFDGGNTWDLVNWTMDHSRTA
jgi:hypothetical protein